MKSGSNLERILESGQFAVTGEVGPPKGTSPKVIQRKGELLKLCCDALNVTDNQTAIVRMSSISGCVLLKEQGVEPVLQMVVRDRNRLGLQGDLLGAAALGIQNVLCLSGDHQKFGNHPTAKGVYDIDSIQFIQMVKTMRDEHKFINGEDISGDAPFFIGAAANPFADPFEFRVTRLAKKINAGADFIQTQGIFDVPKFIEWMKMVRDRGLHEKTHIIAGLIPMKAVGMARYMANNVPGLSVPKVLVDRMADSKEPKEEGVKICIEAIEQLTEVEGVHGVHIMAVAWEDIVPRIVEEAGLMPRPVI